VRIAYVAFEAFPNSKGSGTRIRELSRGLAAQGAEVHLVSLSAKPGAGEPPPGVELRPLKLLEDNLLARGLAFRGRVLRELMAIRPDVIHFRGIFEGEAALAYAEQRAVRTLFEVNGLPSVELGYHYRAVAESQSMQGKLRELEGRILAGVDCALTQSQTTLEFLRSRGLPSATACAVLPNAADPEMFYPAAERAADATAALRLLYVGATQAWQGTLELLMAQRRVLRERPARLVIAGPIRRKWRKQIERLTRRLKLDDTVELMGALHAEQLAQQIREADICLAPLRRDVRNKHQGCSPIKLFEYMSGGAAVLATDLPCVREIVTPDVTGELLESPRPKLLADALLGLASDPARRGRLGHAARQFILDEATWERRRAALVAYYVDTLLASAASRASA